MNNLKLIKRIILATVFGITTLVSVWYIVALFIGTLMPSFSRGLFSVFFVIFGTIFFGIAAVSFRGFWVNFKDKPFFTFIKNYPILDTLLQVILATIMVIFACNIFFNK